MIFKRPALQVFACLIVVFINQNVSAIDCKNDCDDPWPPKCVSYCLKQGLALSQRSFSNALVYIAWRKGFFHEEGIDTAVAYYGNSFKVMNRIINPIEGKPTFGLVNAKVALGIKYEGVPIKAILAVEDKLPVIFASPKEVVGVQKLKGMKVAVPTTCGALASLYPLLLRKGANIYALDYPSLPKLLKAKKVDFAAVPIAQLPALEKYGFKIAIPSKKIAPPLLTSVIAINEKYAIKKDVVKFSAAMLKAIDFFYKNKTETINIVEKELAPKGFSKRDLDILYDFYKINAIFKKDGKITPEAFNSLQPKFKFEDTVDSSYLESLKIK